jgi:hypothetical protein
MGSFQGFGHPPIQGWYTSQLAMSFIKDLLVKLRFSVALLLVGSTILLLSQYTLSGPLNKLEVHARSSTSLVYLLAGIGLTLLSLLVYLADQEEVTLWTKCRLSRTDNGFKAVFKDSGLFVDFGVLQNLYSPIEGSVLVLPANEFFDDRCFNDVRTAAGAFIRSHFDVNQAVGLKHLVEQELKSRPSEPVPGRGDTQTKSYGTGTCVYLDHPFGTAYRLILAAVATDRPATGIRAEMASIFNAMAGVHRIVAAERGISVIYIPLLGAGKGGVPPKLALRGLIIAALEARCAEGGHAMKEIHLVIHQPEGKDPLLSRRQSRKAVRELITLYQEISR